MFMIHPPDYATSKKFVQRLLVLIGIINLLLIFLFPVLPVFVYLLCVLTSLLVVIVIMTLNWSRIESGKLDQS